MKNPYYNYEETEEELLRTAKTMLLAQEELAALLEDVRDNETEEAFQAVLSKFKLDRKTVDIMIAAYQKEVSNGEK
ncbi:MAG: hypothetical protein LBK62_11680 [Treponema sp.]|jgi:phytoene/squalene synthetase|nr:hypothetical protein [Treponema sp.]